MPPPASIIGAAVVFVYAVLGGMKGITYTQVAQYVVLIIAYTVPAIFISLNLTGNPSRRLGLFSNTEVQEGVPLLVRLDQVITELGFNSYTGHHTNTLNMVLFTLSLMIGTAGLPHVIIRFFTVPKVADARWSAGWALVFIALLYLTAPAVGAMARLNIMDTLPQPGPVGAEDGSLLYEERPDWFRNWEQTGLLQFEDKNADGRIQFYNDRNETFAAQADGVGLGRQRADHQPGHPGAGQPGDRAAAELGRWPGRRRRSRRRAVDRGGPPARHLLGDQPRPDQEHHQPEHLGQG
jgi:cation/acetate symporter